MEEYARRPRTVYMYAWAVTGQPHADAMASGPIPRRAHRCNMAERVACAHRAGTKGAEAAWARSSYGWRFAFSDGPTSEVEICMRGLQRKMHTEDFLRPGVEAAVLLGAPGHHISVAAASASTTPLCGTSNKIPVRIRRHDPCASMGSPARLTAPSLQYRGRLCVARPAHPRSKLARLIDYKCGQARGSEAEDGEERGVDQ